MGFYRVFFLNFSGTDAKSVGEYILSINCWISIGQVKEWTGKFCWETNGQERKYSDYLVQPSNRLISDAKQAESDGRRKDGIESKSKKWKTWKSTENDGKKAESDGIEVQEMERI